MLTAITPHGGATSTHQNAVAYGGGQKRVRSPSKNAPLLILSSAMNDTSASNDESNHGYGFEPIVRAETLKALEVGGIACAKLRASMEGTISLSNSMVDANDVKRVVGQRAEGGLPLFSSPPSHPGSLSTSRPGSLTPSRLGSPLSEERVDGDAIDFISDSSEWLDFVTMMKTEAERVEEEPLDDSLSILINKILMIWREFKDKHDVVDKLILVLIVEIYLCARLQCHGWM